MVILLACKFPESLIETESVFSPVHVCICNVHKISEVLTITEKKI